MTSSSFLNRCSSTNVGGKFRVLLKPLFYHRAGPCPPQHVIDDAEETGDYTVLRLEYPGVIIVPPGVTSDGPSVPPYWVFILIGSILAGLTYTALGPFAIAWVWLATWVRAKVDPEKFRYPGYLHDFLCTWLVNGRAAADGDLRVACAAVGMGWFSCYAVYLGVRLGTFIKYKTVVPEIVQKQAVNVFAKSKKLLSSDFRFDVPTSIVVKI
jgi:hypothetical protein